MRHLTKAIIARMNGRFGSRLPGGVHRERPDANKTKMPYAVVRPQDGNGVERNTSRQRREQVVIEWQVWTTDDATADQLVEDLTAAFDPAPGDAMNQFALDRGSVLQSTKESSNVSEEPEVDPMTGLRVWQGFLSIRYDVQWTPGE